MSIKLQKLIKDTESALSAATNRYGFFNINSEQKEKLNQALLILEEIKVHIELK